MIGLVAIAGVSIALIMTLLRLFSGPSLYDRAMAATLVLIELALIVCGRCGVCGVKRRLSMLRWLWCSLRSSRLSQC